MGRAYCNGAVTSLADQIILLTGKALIDGSWVQRPQMREVLTRRGARVAKNQHKSLTLIVWGELAGNVIDPVHDRSQKIIFAARERTTGNHICVIDNNGISDLLRGQSARCLETHLAPDLMSVEIRSANSLQTMPQVPDIFGEVVEPRHEPEHDSDGLTLDLTALDRGTAAHEALVVSLRQHLAGRGVSVHAPSAAAPRFDAGWEITGEVATVYIAELKSITIPSESQQIRLGIGQVLDYVHTVRNMAELRGRRALPVLILEHAPSNNRWAQLAESLGITLSWAPDFPGV